MDRKQFIDALFARAKEAGFEACEVYYSAADSFNASVFKGELIKYSVSGSLGLGFRGLLNGRMGYASTQILDEDAIDLLIDGAKTNAELIQTLDDVMKIQADGRAKRLAAEAEMAKMENDLKVKLLQIRNGG